MKTYCIKWRAREENLKNKMHGKMMIPQKSLFDRFQKMTSQDGLELLCFASRMAVLFPEGM